MVCFAQIKKVCKEIWNMKLRIEYWKELLLALGLIFMVWAFTSVLAWTLAKTAI